MKLLKLRMPKKTLFKTLVLLLQPSIYPLDHGTSMEMRIPWNQLWYAFVRSWNLGKSITLTDKSQPVGVCLPVAEELERITAWDSFLIFRNVLFKESLRMSSCAGIFCCKLHHSVL